MSSTSSEMQIMNQFKLFMKYLRNTQCLWQGQGNSTNNKIYQKTALKL